MAIGAVQGPGRTWMVVSRRGSAPGIAIRIDAFVADDGLSPYELPACGTPVSSARNGARSGNSADPICRMMTGGDVRPREVRSGGEKTTSATPRSISRGSPWPRPLPCSDETKKPRRPSACSVHQPGQPVPRWRNCWPPCFRLRWTTDARARTRAGHARSSEWNRPVGRSVIQTTRNRAGGGG